MSGVRKGPVIDPGTCRGCGASKKCRILNVEYYWMGVKEIYSDMFVDSFGLLLSHLDGEPEERLICATCVSRLRDATAFRRQVLSWEEKLLQAQIHVHTDGGNDCTDIKVEGEVELEFDEKSQGESSHVDGEHKEVNDTHIADDDAGSISCESDKPLKALKKKKKSDKTKSVKRKSKVLCTQDLGEGKRTLRKKRQLKQAEEMVRTTLNTIDSMIPAPPRPKVLDNEHKAFRNTITMVECSYVCPFDTSYSDYYCIYCREVFTDPDKLREHTLTHDPTTFKDSITNKKIPQIDITRIDCRLCQNGIDNIDNLKHHLSSVHGKSFYPVVNEFLKFQLTLNNLTCTECSNSFSFFHALKKHMAEHFGTCICDVCGAHYFEERMLILHQKSHQRIEESFACKECGKVFKSKHSRYLHIARTHKKEPAYQCNRCDEVLFSYWLRYRHMIEVHGEQRMFSCEHCDRAYDTRKSLREHNRRFHLKIYKHQCDLCDKRFYLPSRLKEHMATHTGERNFRCEYCGKSYPRLRGLKVHMQSHVTEKKYRCVMCNASFTQNVNLKNHMKRQHQSLELEERYQE